MKGQSQFNGSYQSKYKVNSPRNQRNYDNFRFKYDNNRDSDYRKINENQQRKIAEGQYRKHNSPDINRNKYINQNNDKILITKKNKNPIETNGKNGKKQQENGAKNFQKDKELVRNSSSPTLNSNFNENEEYQKLHEKLNFIEQKIATMKQNVQKKRQERQKKMELKKKKEKEKQEQRKNQKVDLKQFVTQVPEHQGVHTFDTNPYEPKHDIYYISQIIKSFKDEKSLGRQHLLTSLHILRVLENSKFATDEEMRERMVTLPRRPGYENKKSVIFDLDETLIHCNDTLTPPFDIKLPITFPTGEVIEAGINVRPHATQILQNLSKDFEVIVFTASHSCYANVVLDYLDPQNKYIHHRLFRDHCFQTPQGMYTKDLRIMDRDLSSIVLVDNAAYSYASQLDNGIPILPYYHGDTDFQLKILEKYCISLLKYKDVRDKNREVFQLKKYRHYYNQPEKLIEQLYLKEEDQILGK